MKKELIFVLTITMLLALTACNTSDGVKEAGELNRIKDHKMTSISTESNGDSVIETDADNNEVIYYVAEIINTGKNPICFEDAFVLFESANRDSITMSDFLKIKPTVIMPGKSAYFSEQVYNSSTSDDTSVDLDAIENGNLYYEMHKAEEPQIPPIKISDIEIKEKDGYPSLKFRATNMAKDALEDINVVAPLYSEDNLLETAISTIISLEGGESKEFEQTAVSCPSSIDCSNLTAKEVIPYYNSSADKSSEK